MPLCSAFQIQLSVCVFVFQRERVEFPPFWPSAGEHLYKPLDLEQLRGLTVETLETSPEWTTLVGDLARIKEMKGYLKIANIQRVYELIFVWKHFKGNKEAAFGVREQEDFVRLHGGKGDEQYILAIYNTRDFWQALLEQRSKSKVRGSRAAGPQCLSGAASNN